MLRTFLKNDMHYMKKDPMVWMIFAAPVLFGLIYRIGILRLELLEAYRSAAEYVFAVMVSFLTGMVIGFRMLDEKDEHMLSFYAVSPIGLKGYITFRVLLTMGLAAASILVLSLFGIIPKAQGIFISIQAVLLAPLVFLILGVIGKNKIQGLTLVKIIGMVFMLPVLTIIKENPFDKVFILIPSYNIFELFVNRTFDYRTLIYLLGLGSIIYGLMDYFNNKCISEI